MTSTTEGEHTLPDGFKVYTKTWHTAENPPKAILVYLHGFSDHCNAYYEFFPRLTSMGIEVRSFDQRGWGRSVRQKSQRGLTGPTSTVISDLCSFLSTLPTSSTSPPLFLFGHSMGGGLSIYYHLLTLLSASSNPTPYLPPNFKPPQFTGIIFGAPWIALPPPNTPSALKVYVGRLAAKILPRFQLPNKIDPKAVSRNPQVCEDWAKDELCHDTVTLEGAADMLDRHGELESISKGKQENTTFAPLYSSTSASASTSEQFVTLSRTPLLIIHGSGDLVTSYDATKALFTNTPTATSTGSSKANEPKDSRTNNPLPFIPAEVREFRTLEGGYHKLHADLPGTEEDFARLVGGWVLHKTGEKWEGKKVEDDKAGQGKETGAVAAAYGDGHEDASASASAATAKL